MTATSPVGGSPSTDGADRSGVRARSSARAVVAWLGLLVVARVVGLAYVSAHDGPLAVDAVPWVGRWTFDPANLPALVVAGLVGVAVVAWLPVVAVRWPWRSVLVTTAAAAAALAGLFARAGDHRFRWGSIQWGYGQHTDLVDAHGVVAYFRDYVTLQPDLPGHLRAHPPGLVFGLWGFERVGLSGTGFQLTLVLAAGAVASVAALVSLRAVAGESLARAAAPFVVVAPVLVWRTNPDVVFAAVALSGVALALVGTCRPAGRRGDAWALAGGFVFSMGLLLSYGTALLAVPVLAVAVDRRAWRRLALVSAGGVVGLALPLLVGFSWLAGLRETDRQYHHSLARARGYRYWLLGNAATFAGLVGPATFAGLRRLRAAPGRVLVLAGLACPVLAGLSGRSSAETERIWQPFAPLVLLAGAYLWWRRGHYDLPTARWWLGLQLAVALAFQAVLRSAW